ncbi:MAG: cytochrome P450 [Candidatus Omnitrophica bacterium]|nr:cytochrome P450 [Candidatus Omnitrophota bacterium]
MTEATTESIQHDLEKIPGPLPHPILGWRGNLFRFLSDPLAYMQMLRRTYGEIAVFVRRPENKMVFTFHPKYNQQILSNPDLFNSVGITHLGPEGSAHRKVGHGLLSMNGPQHKQQRRLIMLPFQRNHIVTYRDAIVEIVEDVTGRWRSGSRLDMFKEMKELTRRISSKILLGLDASSKAFSVSAIMEKWLELNISIKTRLLPIDYLGLPYHRMLQLAEKLERETIAMIEQKRSEEIAGSDVLSILIRAHDEDGTTMTDDELIGQANILFAASHETTSSSLVWILFLLAEHPAVYANLVDELSGRLKGSAPTFDELNQLSLLDRVIKEGMRILPAAVYTYRLSTVPFELGPYHLPERTTVALSHYITHHMPEIYPEPERFNPDRWLTCSPTPYEYLAFGAGPRACIGGGFATMAMKLSLAMIVQRFRLSVVPHARINRHLVVTMGPQHGMPMTVHEQDRRFGKNPVRGNIHEMVDLR